MSGNRWGPGAAPKRGWAAHGRRRRPPPTFENPIFNYMKTLLRPTNTILKPYWNPIETFFWTVSLEALRFVTVWGRT